MFIIGKDEIPSRMYPYQQDVIKMTKFGVKQLMLISRAVYLNSIEPVIEALDQVTDIDAYTLTDGDFFYLLTLQRVAAYENNPLVASWYCDATVYKTEDGKTYTKDDLRKLVEDYDLAEDKTDLVNPDSVIITEHKCSHLNTLPISTKDLSVVYLEKPITNNAGITTVEVDYPRINTLAQSHIDLTIPEKAMLVNAARLIKKTDDDTDQFDILEKLDPATVQALMDLSNNTKHGLSTIVTKSCSKCGHAANHRLEVNAQLFFEV